MEHSYDPAEISKRFLERLEEEEDHPLMWWYLSFAGKEGWRGALVVEARGFISAVTMASLLCLNPGGEVKGFLVPPDKLPAKEFTYRLLNKADLESAWGEQVKTMAEWDADAQKG